MKGDVIAPGDCVALACVESHCVVSGKKGAFTDAATFEKENHGCSSASSVDIRRLGTGCSNLRSKCLNNGGTIRSAGKGNPMGSASNDRPVVSQLPMMGDCLLPEKGADIDDCSEYIGDSCAVASASSPRLLLGETLASKSPSRFVEIDGDEVGIERGDCFQSLPAAAPAGGGALFFCASERRRSPIKLLRLDLIFFRSPSLFRRSAGGGC